MLVQFIDDFSIAANPAGLQVSMRVALNRFHDLNAIIPGAAMRMCGQFLVLL